MNTSSPFRLLIVGCGGIAGAWLDALVKRSDVVIAGFVDLNLARAGERAAKYAPEAITGTDLATMIASVRPDIVIDLTIPDAHADVACLALAAGCHVLSEKPLAADMDGARRILAAAQASGKIHAVMQNRRFLPAIYRLRQTLASGMIGSLTELHADFFIGAHFDGFRAAMDHVLLLDMSIHSFDQARFIGDLKPLAVNAVEWNPAGSWYKHGASTFVCVECVGGTRVTYRGSWCSEGANTSWECSWRAVCTQGSALWDGRETISVEGIDPTSSGLVRKSVALEPSPAVTLPLQGHAGCIDEMLFAIREGRTPMTVGSDNIFSLAIVQAAIKSAENGGRRVSIDEI